MTLKNSLIYARVNVNAFTCAVCHIAEHWVDELIYIVIARTGFHFHWIKFIIATVIVPVAADMSGDHPILDSWVLTI